MAIVTLGIERAKNVFAGQAQLVIVQRSASSMVMRQFASSILAVRRGLDRDRVDLYRGGAATQVLEAQVLEREAIEILEPFQRVARDEEPALEVSRRLLDA